MQVDSAAPFTSIAQAMSQTAAPALPDRDDDTSAAPAPASSAPGGSDGVGAALDVTV
jgi:hypothetical protein